MTEDEPLRATLADTVRRLSQSLEQGPPEQTERVVVEALAEAARISGAERAGVYAFSTDRAHARAVYSWAAKRAPAPPSRRRLKMARFPWWVSQCSLADAIAIPAIRDLAPEAAPERDFFQASSTRSALVVPLRRDNHTFGFVLFETTTREIPWPEETARLLTALCSQIGRPVAERLRARGRERVIEGLRSVIAAADELHRCESFDCLCRRSIEVARDRLGIERCSLFLVEGEQLRGTYGTDRSGRARDERGWVLPESVLGDTFRLRLLGAKGLRWTIQEDAPLLAWRDGQATVAGHGWFAVTAILSDRRREPVGYLFNDTAHSGAPVDALQQEVLAVFCSMLGNVVEEKRAEAALHRSQDRLRQAHKMEAVGRMAGGIAHDFNNLLTSIIGFSKLLADQMEPDDSRRNDLLEILQAGQTASQLTDKLLALGRRQMLRLQPTDLNAVVRHAEPVLRETVGEGIEVLTELRDGLPPARTDTSAIEQVLLDLALNARDAMPEGGALTIRTWKARFRKPEAESTPHLNEGVYACLSVSDTGHGMTAEVREHAFDPFFTTKGRGPGAGLGLSTVYGVVHQCGGCLDIDSDPGQGTRVVLYLPVAESGAAPAGAPATDRLYRGSETVLVIEDEDRVRALVARMLSSLGYKVLEADGGPRALEMVRDLDDPLHLVLSDMVMPQMGGQETVREMRKIRDDFRVLFVSGFAGDQAGETGVAALDAEFLKKPFTRQMLSAKVRSVLDAS